MKHKAALRNILGSILLFAVFFAIGAGAEQALLNLRTGSDESAQLPGVMVKGIRTNILILGVDARPGQSNIECRTDSMLLVSLDPDLKKIAVVSIPRDTQVKIKGSTQKINAANEYGGPELAAQMVGELLATKVDYYMVMNFNGFKDIIDTLGGVNINVAQRMYKPSENIDLKPGLQKLDGTQALAYVRYRDYVYGDIQRTEQQQEFLKALAREVLQPKTIPELPQLASEVYKNMTTNLSLTDTVKLAAWAPAFSPDAIISQTLPGTFYADYLSDGSSASYWKVDQRLAGQILNDLFDGRTVAVIQGESSSNAKNDPVTPAAPQKKPSNNAPITSPSKVKTTSTPATIASAVQDKPDDSKSTTQKEPQTGEEEQPKNDPHTAQPSPNKPVAPAPGKQPML
ncbi:MAG TPA: LCP family protein [Syntrophomonadaceae bacterium]|nr:LCP family protein [Syntrophomonadaceae bacterium]